MKPIYCRSMRLRVGAAGGVAVATDTLANAGPLDAVFIVSDTPVFRP